MTPHVWVIEMKNGTIWEPCSDCFIDRNDARFSVQDWQARNPDDEFRVAKYVRDEE